MAQVPLYADGVRKSGLRIGIEAGCTFSELSSRDPMQGLRLSPGFIANADEVIE
jgi:hypothetical protein